VVDPAIVLRRPLLIAAFAVLALPTGGAGTAGAQGRPEDEIAPKGAKWKPAPIIREAEMHKAITRHKGRVVLLHLWATWCLPCLDELSMVAKFAREAQPKGVELVSISLDDDSVPAAWKVGRILYQKTGGQLASRIVKVADRDAFVAGVDPRWDGQIPALFAYDQLGRLRKALVGPATREGIDSMVADLIARPAK
jgi:thiol-disulfide isomerase/thioredoxin